MCINTFTFQGKNCLINEKKINNKNTKKEGTSFELYKKFIKLNTQKQNFNFFPTILTI